MWSIADYMYVLTTQLQKYIVQLSISQKTLKFFMTLTCCVRFYYSLFFSKTRMHTNARNNNEHMACYLLLAVPQTLRAKCCKLFTFQHINNFPVDSFHRFRARYFPRVKCELVFKEIFIALFVYGCNVFIFISTGKSEKTTFF